MRERISEAERERESDKQRERETHTHTQRKMMINLTWFSDCISSMRMRYASPLSDNGSTNNAFI